MCTQEEVDGRDRRTFLSDLGEDVPCRFDRYKRWLDDRAGDTRCVCAATCPFHHPPGEEQSRSGERAPWDPS